MTQRRLTDGQLSKGECNLTRPQIGMLFSKLFCLVILIWFVLLHKHVHILNVSDTLVTSKVAEGEAECVFYFSNWEKGNLLLKYKKK